MDTKKVKVTVSLSRAHKIVERLKEKLAELGNAMQSGFGVVHVEAYTGPEQIKAFQQKREEAEDAYMKYSQYLRIMTDIRKAIGKANVDVVSDLLAEQAMLNSRLGMLKMILRCDRSNAIMPQDLEHYRPLVQTDRPMLHRNAGVAVTLLTKERKGAFEEELADVQRKLYIVSDKITDANATKIEIELPAMIADDLGLA